MRRAFTEDFTKHVVNCAASPTATYKGVAKKYGISECTVRRWCKEAGLFLIKQKRVSEKQWRQIEPLLGRIPDADISRQFGLAPSTICERRQKMGILAASHHKIYQDAALGNIELNKLLFRWERPKEVRKFVRYLENWKLAKRLYG